MEVFDKERILNEISNLEVIQALRNGLVEIDKGAYQVPDRMHLDMNNGTYLVMPALNEHYCCTKLVSVIPGNRDRGLPLIQGFVLLTSQSDGRSLALLDAPVITALRTAAVGGNCYGLFCGPCIRFNWNNWMRRARILASCNGLCFATD